MTDTSTTSIDAYLDSFAQSFASANYKPANYKPGTIDSTVSARASWGG